MNGLSLMQRCRLKVIEWKMTALLAYLDRQEFLTFKNRQK